MVDIGKHAAGKFDDVRLGKPIPEKGEAAIDVFFPLGHECRIVGARPFAVQIERGLTKLVQNDALLVVHAQNALRELFHVRFEVFVGYVFQADGPVRLGHHARFPKPSLLGDIAAFVVSKLEVRIIEPYLVHTEVISERAAVEQKPVGMHRADAREGLFVDLYLQHPFVEIDHAPERIVIAWIVGPEFLQRHALRQCRKRVDRFHIAIRTELSEPAPIEFVPHADNVS